jgi:hypothetical protein
MGSTVAVVVTEMPAADDSRSPNTDEMEMEGQMPGKGTNGGEAERWTARRPDTQDTQGGHGRTATVDAALGLRLLALAPLLLVSAS